MMLFVGFEGLAFAPSVSIIKIFVFLAGFSGGAINGATNALMADISENNKGANLSLLGVFFGIGALGMPLALGLLKEIFRFETIVASVGLLSLITGIFYLVIKFPPPKQSHGYHVSNILIILKDRFILLIAFFLFFQSSFEGIINNWTTTYLIDHTGLGQRSALFGLSVFVAGMASMRLITGTLLRSARENKILYAAFWFILSGLVILDFGQGIILSYCGLFILGAGLASGFPVMLGFTGNLYAELSGTAFSIVLAIALLGNMSVNYLMGIIAKNFGIQHLTTVAMIELIMLALLAAFILKKIKSTV
jgi:fucose permease